MPKVLSLGVDNALAEIAIDVPTTTDSLPEGVANLYFPEAPTDGKQYARKDAGWTELGGGTGTVTSVGLSVPTGLSVSGSPVTTSGTIAITYSSGYRGYTNSESSKLAGIAAGATVGATWGTNLSNIPANITSWAGIAPSTKQDALGYTPANSALILTATAPLTGGGDLTANRSIGISPATQSAAGSMSAADKAKLDNQGTAATYNIGSTGNTVPLCDSSPRFVRTHIFTNGGLLYDTGDAIGIRAGTSGPYFTFNRNGNMYALNGQVVSGVNGVRPLTDNDQPCGASGTRWSVVYAGTGTINTSDSREKTPVRSLNSAELGASIALAKEIGAYKWLAMVAEKGDSAREHIGMTVQRCVEIMELHGLDAFNYGFVCYDEWEELEEILGEDGEVMQAARPAGNRYSFRMDELAMFILAGQNHRLEILEEKLSKM